MKTKERLSFQLIGAMKRSSFLNVTVADFKPWVKFHFSVYIKNSTKLYEEIYNYILYTNFTYIKYISSFMLYKMNNLRWTKA